MNWKAKIHRESVLLAIGAPNLERVPEDMDQTFEHVTIFLREYAPKEEWKRDDHRSYFKFTEPQLVDVTLIVRPLKRHIIAGRIVKLSKHRTFIVCPRCGEEVPTGRYHQHVGTKRCNEGESKRIEAALATVTF